MAIKAALSTIAPLTIQQAAAEIIQLINTRPTSPRPDEIEAIIARVASGCSLLAAMPLSAEQAQLHEAIQHLVDIGKTMGAEDYREGLEKRHHQAYCRVEELAERIPTPARSLTDVILRAQVAWALADRQDGVLRDIDEPDAEGAAARTIQAVFDFAAITYS
jgi:hypothetical protein